MLRPALQCPTIHDEPVDFVGVQRGNRHTRGKHDLDLYHSPMRSRNCRDGQAHLFRSGDAGEAEDVLRLR